MKLPGGGQCPLAAHCYRITESQSRGPDRKTEAQCGGGGAGQLFRGHTAIWLQSWVRPLDSGSYMKRPCEKPPRDSHASWGGGLPWRPVSTSVHTSPSW